MKQHPVAFAVAYALIGAQALAALAAFVVIMFTPVTPVAHKSDVTNGLGATKKAELIKLAEQNIAGQAQSSGVTILSQKVVKFDASKKNEVDIDIKVSTAEIGEVTLRVQFHKGIYSISGVTRV